MKISKEDKNKIFDEMMDALNGEDGFVFIADKGKGQAVTIFAGNEEKLMALITNSLLQIPVVEMMLRKAIRVKDNQDN